MKERLEDGFATDYQETRGGRLLRLLDVSRLAGERIIAYMRHGFWEKIMMVFAVWNGGEGIHHRSRSWTSRPPALG